MIDVHYIKHLNDYEIGELVYGDLYVCGWCVMKGQITNQNKSIHEEYINRTIVWVLLCTDVERQTLFFDTFAGDRFFLL